VTTERVPEPELPDGITPGELDAEARRDLRGLQKDTADIVAKHLVAAGMLVDEDPERALEHARFARRRASRIAVVREAAGIAAYHAGEWNEALGELRAARRMGGGPGHLAVMADIERALGRPERALELVRAPEAKELGRAESIELAIVAAGARRDLGELDAAVVGLQIPELDPSRRDAWSARLFYAYADNLLTAGRESDALQWFVHTANADVHGETDADERIADLTGEPLEDDGVEFQGEDELAVDDVDDDLADESADHGVVDHAVADEEGLAGDRAADDPAVHGIADHGVADGVADDEVLGGEHADDDAADGPEDAAPVAEVDASEVTEETDRGAGEAPGTADQAAVHPAAVHTAVDEPAVDEPAVDEPAMDRAADDTDAAALEAPADAAASPDEVEPAEGVAAEVESAEDAATGVEPAADVPVADATAGAAESTDEPGTGTTGTDAASSDEPGAAQVGAGDDEEEPSR
jgi:hypothetical protein